MCAHTQMHVHTHTQMHVHTHLPLEDGTVLGIIFSRYCLCRPGLPHAAPERLCYKNPVFFTCTTFQSGPRFKTKPSPLHHPHLKGKCGPVSRNLSHGREVEVIQEPHGGWSNRGWGQLYMAMPALLSLQLVGCFLWRMVTLKETLSK